MRLRLVKDGELVSRLGNESIWVAPGVLPRFYTTKREALEETLHHYEFTLGQYQRDCLGKRIAQETIIKVQRELKEA